MADLLVLYDGKGLMDARKIMLPEYCIWDFNGTILDDVDAGIRAVNHLLAARGLKQIASREAYQAVFGFPIREYYEKLGFDFEAEPYEVVAPQWVEQYLNHVKQARMFEDVKETIAFLNARGVRQVVLSATERRMLCGQLADLGITDCFEEVLGLDNIHAASKLSLAKEWRARHPEARVLFLGDTDHDVETARAMDAECVLIARGHQSAEKLKNFGAPIFADLRELREAIKI